MAFLFEVNNGVATPTTETLLIPLFQEIWDRDSSEDKHVAISEYTYIEFMCSMKSSNPFKGYELNDRKIKLIDQLFDGENREDELILQGIDYLKDIQTKGSYSYRFYTANLKAVEELITFFSTVDISEKNERGQLLYKPKDITAAINDCGKTLQSLKSLESKVEQEIYEATKTKGNKEIGEYED